MAAPLTLDDYLALPDDGLQYEVVEGQPVVNPAPSPRHQIVVARLLALLTPACPPGFVAVPAPVDWVLWDRPRLHVRQPDVVVIPADAGDEPLAAAPLLAIEVVSQYSLERDLVTKRDEYGRAGLRHYWVVDPAEPSIVVYRASQGRELSANDRAIGEQRLTVMDPVVVSTRPADLVGSATS